jgi:hypothetical protein
LFNPYLDAGHQRNSLGQFVCLLHSYKQVNSFADSVFSTKQINSNEEAEEVMKRVEKEEMLNPDRKSFHLCIINLVIGTLYCAKASEY